MLSALGHVLGRVGLLPAESLVSGMGQAAAVRSLLPLSAACCSALCGRVWREVHQQAAQQAERATSGGEGPSTSAPDNPADSTSVAQGDAASPSFATSTRRVTAVRKGTAGNQGLLSLEGIVHIQNTFNNIIVTLTDKQGFIKAYTSAGQVGFKGSRKSQPVAAERAAEELARRALKMGYTTVQVKLKGNGSNKQYAVQSLHATGLRITHLMDVTGIPYNGCRPPKKRRV